ncbi:MAG: EcsC family protein [Moraxellaceae bacterium]
MSEQYSATDEQAPSRPLWQRLSQRVRQLSDQAGQTLGKLTEFEQVKQHATAKQDKPQHDQDPMQLLREQLPNLSRQLLVGRFASVSRLASQLMPHELLDRVSDHVLEQAVQFAELLSGNDALYDELGLLSLSDLRQLDLARADELADLVASRNRLLGAAEGAATGLAGFIGTLADLPLSVIIVLRTIYQTAECYGYDLADVDGRQKIYQVLADTDWGVLVEKQSVLLSLVSVQQLLKQGGIAGLQKMVGSAGDLDVFEKLVQEVAASLNVRLPENLTGRALPIAGAAVGAFYNTRLINSVAALAQATFRQQRLASVPMISRNTTAADLPVSTAAPEISAEAVFGHSAAEEKIKPQPKKRMVRVKKTSDGEMIPNSTEIVPNNDTQH